MGIMSIYINWMYFFCAMAVVGGQERDSQLCKTRGFQSPPHEGQVEIRRAEASGELLVFVCFSHCQLLGI